MGSNPDKMIKLWGFPRALEVSFWSAICASETRSALGGDILLARVHTFHRCSKQTARRLKGLQRRRTIKCTCESVMSQMSRLIRITVRQPPQEIHHADPPLCPISQSFILAAYHYPHLVRFLQQARTQLCQTIRMNDTISPCGNVCNVETIAIPPTALLAVTSM